MVLKTYLGPALAAFFVCAAASIPAQNVHSATRDEVPLAVGAGISVYNTPDFGHRHLLGGTLWIDYFPSRVPSFLRGIGLEVKGLALNYGRTTTLSADLREDVASGGVIYSWPRYRNFRPYAKFMMGFSNVDYIGYEGTTQVHLHDSRTVTSLGGGVEYRVFRYLWARVDYEYQAWPDIFNTTSTTGTIDPHGFTVGAMYHFSQHRSH